MTKTTLISKAEAAKLCSYEQEYLSLLARRRELKAEKMGRNWFTTIDNLNDYIATKKPSEIITPASEEKESGPKKVEYSQRLVWGVFVFFSIIILAGALIFRVMFKKVADIENKTKNQFVTEEITKVPNDQGNYDIYGTGRMKLGTEKRIDANLETN